MAKRVTITRDDGELGTINEADLAAAMASGFRVVDESEAKTIEKRRAAQSTGGMAIGAAEAAARGLSMGASDVGLRALGVDTGQAKARQENLGTLGVGLELAGAVAPAFFTGGSGAAGSVARLTPAGFVARAGAAAEGATARALGSGLRSRVAGAAAQGAVEGFAGGVGAEASAAALGDQDLAIERLLGGGAEGLGMGLLLGGGLGAAGAGSRLAVDGGAHLGRKALGRVGDAAGAAAEQVDSMVAVQPGRLERMARGLGRVMGSGDPDAFARSATRLRTAEGRGRILADLDEVRAKSAGEVKAAVDEANAAVDDAVRLTQGRGKLARAEELMAGVDNAVANPRALEHLRSQQTRLRRVLEEGGDTITPELARDIKKALRLSERGIDDTIKGRSGAEGFKAIDNFKREMDLLAKGRRQQYGRNAAPEIKEAADLLGDLAGTSRKHLEDETIYGKAATMQREVNAAASAEFGALEELRRTSPKLRAMLERGTEADASTALQLARAYGKAGGSSKVTALDQALDARLNYLRVTKQHHDLPPDAAQRIDDAERAVEKMRAQLRDQAETADALEDAWKLREAEGNKSPSITAMSSAVPGTLGMIGMGIGGPLGAAAGSLIGTVARPYTLLRGAAGLLNQIDSMAKWKRGIDSTAMREANVTAGIERIMDGGRDAVRSTARASRQAAAKATRDAGRDPETKPQRITRLLAVRAAVMASAQDPIGTAEQMEDRVAELHDLAPLVARGIVERSAVAVQFLASKAPDVYESEFGRRVKIVAPEELDRFERYVEAVTDPLAAAEKIAAGGFSLEHAEALQVVYPKIFAELQTRALELLGRRKQDGRPVSEEALVELGLMLDMPLTDSLKPGFLSSLQTPASQPAAAAPGSAAPRRSKPLEVTGQRTDLGRLEAGTLRR